MFGFTRYSGWRRPNWLHVICHLALALFGLVAVDAPPKVGVWVLFVVLVNGWLNIRTAKYGYWPFGQARQSSRGD